jgi:hypothetical protein
VRTLLALCAATALLTAGTEPKASAADYPAHATAGKCAIGAEYLARLIPAPDGGFSSGDYIVVEVAVYPPKGVTLPMRASDFRLLFNGTRREIQPQTPGIVAASLKYPDDEGRRGLQSVVGVGPIVLGPRQDRTPRFPGDPRGNPPTPAPPQVPSESKPDASDSPRADYEAVGRYALHEGEADTAVSGLLYYGWKDKLSKLKRIDLVWDGACGRVTVKIL